jgi:hypothetical protein
MFIPDPGPEFFPSPDPHQSILSILTKKISSGLFIPDLDPDFYPSQIPDPGVEKAPDPGSQIRIRKTGHGSNQCCDSGIQCLFDPRIRDPGWLKYQDQDPNIPDHETRISQEDYFFSISNREKPLCFKQRVENWLYPHPPSF